MQLPGLMLTLSRHLFFVSIVSHGVTKLMHVAFNALALGCIGVGLFVTIASRSSPHMSVRRKEEAAKIKAEKVHAMTSRLTPSCRFCR